MVEPESELRHLARAHSLNHSASHTRRERTHGKHPCPSHGERPPNTCSSNSCWPYPAAPSPKEHRAGGSSFRVGEGFKTSDMCPVPKGCSSHWVMQVWRSRVERERETGAREETAAADIHMAARGTSLTSVGRARGGTGQRQGGDTGRWSGCWMSGDAKQKNLASTGRVRGRPAGL